MPNGIAAKIRDFFSFLWGALLDLGDDVRDFFTDTVWRSLSDVFNKYFFPLLSAPVPSYDPRSDADALNLASVMLRLFTGLNLNALIGEGGSPYPEESKSEWQVFFGGFAIGFIMNSFTSPLVQGLVGERLRQVGLEQSRPTLLFAPEIQQAVNRGLRTEDEARADLARAGFDEGRIETLLALRRQLLDMTALIDATNRGLMSEDEFLKNLEALGFNEGDRNVLNQLRQVRPTVSDLIRFAVREVFTPEVREKFGQDEGFPEIFAKEAAKGGLSEEWAKAYWAAHWELPSSLQGFEMLHRGVINRDELDMLLRALDVMPFWRDKLVQIAYRPLTRVDVRRMYTLGVLNREQVKRAYLDLGYDDENAERMTEFTVRYETASDRELSKAEVLRAWKQGVIERDETKQALIDMGYTAESAEIVLATEEAKSAQDDVEAEVKIIEERVKAGELSLDEARTELDRLTLRAKEIELIMLRLQRIVSSSPKMPSVAQVRDWYTTGRIDEGEAREILKQLNVPERFIDLYLSETQEEPRVATVLRWLRNNIIDENEARRLLGRAGVPRDFQDNYIAETLWRPRIADIQRFLALGLIDEQEARKRFAELGVPDAMIKLFIRGIQRRPSVADVQRFFKQLLITADEAQEMLKELNVPDDLIELYLKEAQPVRMRELSRSDILSLLAGQVITRAEAQERLVALGYSEEDAKELTTPPTRELAKNDIVALVKRGVLSRDAGIERLMRLGYRREDAELLLPTGEE